jgi:DNA-binding transcriptional regulator YiaG
MDQRETAGKLKAELEARKELGTRGRFTEALRRQVLEYLRARQAGGGTQEEVARELGMSSWTLSRWSGRARRAEAEEASRARAQGARAFSAVEVRSEVGVSTGALVVHGPGGVRVEGLGVAQVAALLRGLG